MTKEEKPLLLKDLCGRLPYGVKCTTKANSWKAVYPIRGCVDERIFLDCPKELEGDDEWLVQNIVPYLRPITSMTDEEQKEFVQFHCVKLCPIIINEMLTLDNESNMFNWLNAHHFDYRGLIKKGLALEAPTGMYNTKAE